jgi:ABC-type transport system involved in multi-copper enzyme maturation permease subunit
LKIEWIKLKYYKSFWALLGFFMLALLCANYFACKIYYKQLQGAASTPIHGLFNFPQIWQTVSYISGFLFFIPALLIITLVTNEISFGTHRQNIISGISRVQYVNVKFILIAVISLCCTTMVVITVIVLGIHGGGWTISFNEFSYIIYFYLQCINYCTVAYILAIFIKKAGMTIGTFVLYAWVFEKSISGILNSAFKHNVGNYLPLSSSDKLIPIPFGHQAGAELTGKASLTLLVVTMAYLSAMYFIAIQKSKNEDISR